MSNRPDWHQFQEDIKDHFESLGCDARTNFDVQGVRTIHEIDVYIRTKYLGQDLVWLVEAKYWRSKVKKNQVLAFRSIVDDIGADRGFIISNSGFQSGAIEAASKTNISLKTFPELKSDTRELVEYEVLKSYLKRLTLIEDRYWSHSKSARIKYGLRSDPFDYFNNSFDGQATLISARKALLAAVERIYPIALGIGIGNYKGITSANNFQQLSNWLNVNLNYFDEVLLSAEWEMHKNGEYSPHISITPDGERTITEVTAEMLHRVKV